MRIIFTHNLSFLVMDVPDVKNEVKNPLHEPAMNIYDNGNEHDNNDEEDNVLLFLL